MINANEFDVIQVENLTMKLARVIKMFIYHINASYHGYWMVSQTQTITKVFSLCSTKGFTNTILLPKFRFAHSYYVDCEYLVKCGAD